MTLEDLGPNVKKIYTPPTKHDEIFNSKKEVIAIHKQLHAITITHMKHLQTIPQDKLPYDLAVLTNVLSDKLFLAVGVEMDMLDAATDRLQLDMDEEYLIMVRDYTE